MYRSMSSEEHFSKKGSLATSASVEVGSVSWASSWISMLSALSKPAWSLLQKYLPGKSQTCSSEAGKASIDFGHKLITGLDNLMPPDQSPTHLRVAYVHCQHENGRFYTSGDVETLSWLTADTLTELGIQDALNMNFKPPQTPPMEHRYLASARKILSRFLEAREGKHTEVMQPKLSVSCSSTSAANSWWWQGLWRSDDPQNALKTQPALCQTKTSAGAETKSLHCGKHHSSDHCELGCQRSAVAVEKLEEPSKHSKEAEWACSECAGLSHLKESADRTSLYTVRLEFLPSSDYLPSIHEHRVVEHQVGTRAAAACSEVAVLTPDQDNGYSSLEEESASARQCKMNGVYELLDVDGSTASQAGDPGHGGEEDKSAGNTRCERVENDEEDEDEEKTQNTEPAIVHEALPVQSTTCCQNKAISFIMGSPCSDESDMDNSVRDSDDDDGFDSDVLDSSSDSEDLDDSDDEDEEDSESDELDSESERLLNSLFQTKDPYNPRNFTASIRTSQKLCQSASSSCPMGSPVEPDSLLCSTSSSPPSPLEEPQKEEESSEEACSSMDEAESLRLWNSFSCASDPYSPLNFQAAIRTRQPARQRCKKETPVEPLVYRKEEAEERMDSGFSEAALVQGLGSAGVVRLKKVTFIEEVEEFYASSDEERSSPWEEYARDRCRFQRRVQEVEESISYCLTPSFRLNIFQRRYSSS